MVGRAIVITGVVGDSTVRVAQCVLGIDAPAPAFPTPAAVPVVQTASCTFQTTSNAANLIDGYVSLETQADSTVKVSYLISGMPQGAYQWLVHQFGMSWICFVAAMNLRVWPCAQLHSCFVLIHYFCKVFHVFSEQVI